MLKNKKILIISWSDIFGGASIAAYNIFLALKNKKRKVDFFVINKKSKDKSVLSYKKKTFNYFFRYFVSLLFYKLRFSEHTHSYNLLHSDISQKAKFDRYDIINLHWIGGETISIKQISQIKKKVILTLHDMWYFCGSEHYIYNKPLQYFHNGSKKKIFHLDYLIWKIKLKFWSNLKNIKIVTPSRWLENLAKESRIFSKFKIITIPYPVNKQIFFKKKKLSNIYLKNYQLNKKNILFVSAGRLFDYRKGFDLLDHALLGRNDIIIHIIGDFKSNDFFKIKSLYNYIGKVEDRKILSNYYNLFDLLVIPSRLDNLPNVGLEAHSCGMPIVAFNVGGLPDIVTNLETVYLCKPYNLNDLQKGINYVYKSKKTLSDNSLKKSNMWNRDVIEKKYNNLFNEL